MEEIKFIIPVAYSQWAALIVVVKKLMAQFDCVLIFQRST